MSEEGEERERSRKDVLKMAGLAAGALVGGSLLGAQDAAADDGDSLTLGQANTATNKTSLSTSGTISNDGALSVSGTAADYGVFASANSYGVVGSGPGGVLGLGTVGGVFSGTDVAINLDPLTASGAPTGDARKGDLAVDSAGVLWFCIADGTPGTWVNVSQQRTQLLTSAARAYDSRSTSKFAAGEERNVTIAGNFGIPSAATAIIGNLAVNRTEDEGNALIYPAGTTRPGTASINWFAPDQTLNNSYTVRLGTGGAVTLYAANPTHLILDISGYII